MKKIFALLLALAMLFALAACGSNSNANPNDPDDGREPPAVSDETPAPITEDPAIAESIRAAEEESSSKAAAEAEALLAERRRTGEVGEMDLTHIDGYTYHIAWDLYYRAPIDTTVGKPGTVGVNFTYGGTFTLTNTTPGKQAPLLGLKFIPITGHIEEERIPGGIWQRDYEIQLRNPDKELTGLFNAGYDISGTLAVGETRTLEVSKSYSSPSMVSDDKAVLDSLKAPLGWIISGRFLKLVHDFGLGEGGYHIFFVADSLR